MEENMEENTEKNIEEKDTEKNTEKNIEEYSGSSSSQYSKPRSPRSNYSNYNNSNYSNYNNSNYSNYNNLRNLENDDWKLFILLASMKRFEDYTYLFIIVWGAIELNSIECSEEFNDEIGQMYSHIEDLFTNSVIRKQELDKYLSLLDNYRDHCYNDSEAKKELVTRASKKLGKCGLITKYSNKLSKLKLHQYKLLRQMILDRMESFVGISRQSHPVDDEGNSVSLDDPIELRKEIESLRKQNTVLVQENSHYQAKLGDMTNTRLGDQDPNNAAKLISDIKELQQLLSEFTIVQGPEYQINVEKSAKLLTQYKCQTNLEDSRAKLILGGVLQQCIIMQILSDANSYFGKPADNRNLDETVEVNILNTTERLIQQFNHFNEKRPGKDDITPIIPVKVRQQVHAALGYRGFSNDNHPFIVNAAKRIRNAMNEYRKILDSDILNEVDAQSIQIARKVINIFCFRLKTQQIEPKHKFFQSGDEVDTRLMQGSWGGREDKKLEVEVCYFPYIGIFDDNVSNQKIFTKAQVYTRPKKQNDTNSTESSGSSKSIFNMVKSVINK